MAFLAFTAGVAIGVLIGLACRRPPPPAPLADIRRAGHGPVIHLEQYRANRRGP